LHAPSFDAETAATIAAEHFGVHGVASQLASERDQNFLITNSTAEKFVLKISNALEAPELLDAQNAVLNHLTTRVSFCQRLVRAVSDEENVSIQESNGTTHLVRLVHYLPGVPLAEVKPQPNELLRDLGRKLGQLDGALTDFDHPAAHRDFHWDLANGNRIISEFSGLVKDASVRELVSQCRFGIKKDLRRSIIHGDANDYNVLVDPERMTVVGLIDFGDMVYSYTVGNLAVAIAYVVLNKNDPLAAAREVVEGYTSEFALRKDELEVLWPLVLMRLGMSVCLAAYQQQQRPENEYLGVSQEAIRAVLSKLFKRG
jgi:Ser/Thr protein kinase RdoA (MazF antagonist)